MPVPRLRRYAVLTVGLLAGLSGVIRAPTAAAAVVVIANMTEGPVSLEIHTPAYRGRVPSLAPQESQAFPVDEPVEVVFKVRDALRKKIVRPWGLYFFAPFPGGIDLIDALGDGPRRAVTAEELQSPRLKIPAPNPPPGKRQPTRTIPVKILVDEDSQATREVWEPQLRARLETASDVFQKICDVRFEVVAAETWNSSNNLRDIDALRAEFAQKVDLGNAWLAIGWTSQLEVTRGAAQFPSSPEPFARHFLLGSWNTRTVESERVELTVHALAKFLGALESPEPLSVMRPMVGDHRAVARVYRLQLDAWNLLAVNLVAAEIAARGVRDFSELSAETQGRLREAYAEIARGFAVVNAAREAPPEFVVPQTAPLARRRGFTALWVDRSLVVEGEVADWGRPGDVPKLAGVPLLDPQRPFRWLRNEDVPPPYVPLSYVEFFGGDSLPGTVVGYRRGDEDPLDRWPPHLLVNVAVPLNWDLVPEPRVVRVDARWVRRIVFNDDVGGEYQPATLIRRDGSRQSFRTLRLSDGAAQLLTEDGLLNVPLDSIAQLHFPRLDPWKNYFEQLAQLSPDGRSRLMELTTSDGLRATTSLDRFQPQSGVQGNYPDTWLHMIQPAWSLDPLWVRHIQVHMRRLFLPREVPLSRLEPVSAVQKSYLAGGWKWRPDANVRGEPLHSGGYDFLWGYGTSGYTELHFDVPDSVEAFRSWVGLDRAAGAGGCARGAVYTGDLKGTPLFVSRLLVGAADVVDTGSLPLPHSDPSARRLILVTDPAVSEHPPGADPLDVRDLVDWLEPQLELDADILRAELLHRVTEVIPALTGWTLASNPGELSWTNRWESEDVQDPRFRMRLFAEGAPVVLTKKVLVDSPRARLVVAATRPADDSPASKIEVRVDGELLGTYDVPVSEAGPQPEPREFSLEKFHEKEITLEVRQIPAGKHAPVDWRVLHVRRDE